MAESNLVRLGWALYAATWVLLLANIANDWLDRGWVSPLSVLMLVLLAGGTLWQRMRGRPVITTEGMGRRFLATVLLILITLALILAYTLAAR